MFDYVSAYICMYMSIQESKFIGEKILKKKVFYFLKKIRFIYSITLIDKLIDSSFSLNKHRACHKYSNKHNICI